MHKSSTNQPNTSRLASILTDIHFWVPVAVLMGGLLLLRFIR
jgi:hypothetical protein